MKGAELFSCDLSVQPDLAHREDLRIEVDIVHVPDDNSQEGQDSLIAVDDDEDVVDPQGEKGEGKFNIPHEKSADDHHHRAPAHSPVFEFLDEVVASVSWTVFEEPIGMGFERNWFSASLAE